MPDYAAIQKGIVPLSEEAIAAPAASTAIFQNAPVGTRMVQITVRGSTLTLRFDGGAATAGANGQDYGAGRYELTLSQPSALKVRAVGGTGTIYVNYWGLA